MTNSSSSTGRSLENLAAILAAAAGVGTAADNDSAAALVGLDQYIVFDLDEWQLAAPIIGFVSVERLTPTFLPIPIPNAPAWLDGILSVRGDIVSAVDLRTFLGLRRRLRVGPQAEGLGRLLVAGAGALHVGLIVDDIRDVAFIDPAHVAPAAQHGETSLALYPAAAAPFVSGIYTDPKHKRSLALLDTARIITHPRMTNFA